MLTYGPSTTNKKLSAALESILENSDRFTADEVEAIQEAAERIGEIISEDDDDEDED